MARIEKTVFISYRRKDISWALAVYQYLTSQKYDVFFDYSSIPSGDFEQIIISNIKARAHFLLLLTPTALDRCSDPSDWLRREIETAIDEKRNVIPLFFDGFNFSSPSIAEKLSGKLATISHYNGLVVPSVYFTEAMNRLRNQYLKTPLDAIIHPVPTEVRKRVKKEQVAANKALRQRGDIKELIKPVEEKSRIKNVARNEKTSGNYIRETAKKLINNIFTEKSERNKKLADQNKKDAIDRDRLYAEGKVNLPLIGKVPRDVGGVLGMLVGVGVGFIIFGLMNTLLLAIFPGLKGDTFDEIMGIIEIICVGLGLLFGWLLGRDDL